MSSCSQQFKKFSDFSQLCVQASVFRVPHVSTMDYADLYLTIDQQFLCLIVFLSFCRYNRFHGFDTVTLLRTTKQRRGEAQIL